jgi:hypothetical protein
MPAPALHETFPPNSIGPLTTRMKNRQSSEPDAGFVKVQVALLLKVVGRN